MNFLKNKTRQMEKLFDPSLCENSHLKMIRRCIGIGLLCTQEKPNDRPTMWEILDMLDRKNKLPTPRKPRYIKWNSLPRQIVRSTNLKNEPFFCSNSSIIFNLPFSIVCRDEYICTKLFEIHTSAVLPILSWNYAQSYVPLCRLRKHVYIRINIYFISLSSVEKYH